MKRGGKDAPGPLDGEEIGSVHWEDARHWVSIYTDLLRFKSSVIDRIQRELPKLHPDAQTAASADIAIIEEQMAGYQQRLVLWYQRAWQLRGIWIDPDGDVVRHHEQEAFLTKRERQLLQFLLDHPNRYYSARQILNQAWADPALTQGAVRNYVHRLRIILRRLETPCEIVNTRGRGYMLDFPIR